MFLLEVEGEEAPPQELQHLLPPTASSSHHSKTCSGPLILPSDQKEDLKVTIAYRGDWLNKEVEILQFHNSVVKYLAVGF